VRDLARFNELLAWLRGLAAPSPDDKVLIDAFDACHSPAEVYREDEVRQAFGELDGMEPKLAVTLAAKLRENLAGAWRQPDLQEQQGTHRTDQELVAEVTRGYQFAERVLGSAVAKAPEQVEPCLLLATLEFDQAEFLYGQNVELATYTALRDRAFELFRESAEIYARRLSQGAAAEKPSIAVHRQWFQAALGASDLAYLTRQDQPDRDQIDRRPPAFARWAPKPAKLTWRCLANRWPRPSASCRRSSSRDICARRCACWATIPAASRPGPYCVITTSSFPRYNCTWRSTAAIAWGTAGGSASAFRSATAASWAARAADSTSSL
jgi:hypothetical protein